MLKFVILSSAQMYCFYFCLRLISSNITIGTLIWMGWYFPSPLSTAEIAEVPRAGIGKIPTVYILPKFPTPDERTSKPTEEANNQN